MVFNISRNESLWLYWLWCAVAIAIKEAQLQSNVDGMISTDTLTQFRHLGICILQKKIWFRLLLDIVLYIEAATSYQQKIYRKSWGNRRTKKHIHTYKGSEFTTEGLNTKYVCGWKVPAVLLLKYSDKLTPYGSFYTTESNVFFLSLSHFLLYPPPNTLSLPSVIK